MVFTSLHLLDFTSMINVGQVMFPDIDCLGVKSNDMISYSVTNRIILYHNACVCVFI